jgi:hypothetical protein
LTLVDISHWCQIAINNMHTHTHTETHTVSWNGWNHKMTLAHDMTCVRGKISGFINSIVRYVWGICCKLTIVDILHWCQIMIIPYIYYIEMDEITKYTFHPPLIVSNLIVHPPLNIIFSHWKEWNPKVYPTHVSMFSFIWLTD